MMDIGAGLGILFAVVLLAMMVASAVVVIEQHRERRDWKRTILCSLSLIAIWGAMFSIIWWMD